MALNDRPTKTAVLIAQRIIRDVIRDGVEPGSSLLSERVMMEKYQIGRGTLRESLRLLEFQGVITLKPGPKGGPILLRPDASHLSSSLTLLLQLAKAPFRVTVEVRSALEPMISRLAAERIDDDRLEQLHESVTLMAKNIDDEPYFLESNKNFHDIIAWSSGNALFGYLVDSLLNILDGTALGIDYPAHRRTAILKAHEKIYQALSTRDPDAAELAMKEHIDSYVRFARKRYPELFDRVIAWDETLR